MFVRNYELAARRCSAITLGRPTAGSTSIGASRGAKKTQGLLHNLPHDPGVWRLTRGIISNSSTQCDDVSADRQWEGFENSGQICAVRGPKNRRSSIETFTQVLILRILGVRGEVAEWPKAAVC